jgi:hypothetical protein
MAFLPNSTRNVEEPKNITFFLMLPETVGICHGAIFKAWFGVPGTYTQPGFFKTEGK